MEYNIVGQLDLQGGEPLALAVFFSLHLFFSPLPPPPIQ